MGEEKPAGEQNEPLPATGDLWDYDRPAETEERFWKILKGLGRGEHPDYRRELLTQIARARGLQRKFEAGHETLDELEKERGELSARVRVRVLLERGRLFNSANQAEKARPVFEDAFAAAQAAGERALAIDAAHMLGICEEAEAAQQWNHRALELAENAEDPEARKWEGSLLNNLGWTHLERGEFGKGLALFERALAFRERQGKVREIRIARYAVGRALRGLGRVEEAAEVQRRLVREWVADREEDGYVFEELAECELQMGHAAEAKKWFAEAYRALSGDTWLAADQPLRLERLKERGGA